MVTYSRDEKVTLINGNESNRRISAYFDTFFSNKNYYIVSIDNPIVILSSSPLSDRTYRNAFFTFMTTIDNIRKIRKEVKVYPIP